MSVFAGFINDTDTLTIERSIVVFVLKRVVGLEGKGMQCGFRSMT